MDENAENRSKELFDEAQAKQARVVKKIFLGLFCGIGLVFAVVGTVLLLLGELYQEIGMVFLPIGLFFIALGVLLNFVIPTKYNYEKYRAQAEKYGIVNVYAMNAKIAELEARIEELEKNRNSF